MERKEIDKLTNSPWWATMGGQNEMENTQTKNRVYRVGILTPYLSEVLSDEPTNMWQIENAGFSPYNLNGSRFTRTEKGRTVFLNSPESMGNTCKFFRNPSENSKGLELIIAGNTRYGEEEVRELKETGAIVARYSIFYGGPSSYTGNYPEESGYSLDIPKNVETVMKLLKSDDVMNALASRDFEWIKDSIYQLNQSLERPIKRTVWLREALNK